MGCLVGRRVCEAHIHSVLQLSVLMKGRKVRDNHVLSLIDLDNSKSMNKNKTARREISILWKGFYISNFSLQERC